MLNTLLESKATRTRRTGGTVASTLVHAALFAGAITVSTRDAGGKPIVEPPRETATIFIVPQPKLPRTSEPHPTASRTESTPTAPRLPTLDRVPSDIPPIDVNVQVQVASDDEVARGAGSLTGQTMGGPLGGPVGPARDGALDERYVDSPPRILGSPVSPVFPTSLRERGVGGRVAIQFVVDTLGRAEMHGLRVVEASDPLLVQSVRAALPRYRFSPGEVRGQKVRTLVQLPFDFTLVR